MLPCQQAVFQSISYTNYMTILLQHCLAFPSRKSGAESKLQLKSGLSHTFTLPSQSTPTISSLGRKLPASECSLSNPTSAVISTYRLSGRGMSRMKLRRQGVCSRQTFTETLQPQKVSYLASQKYLAATMASFCMRQRKDWTYWSYWSPWRVSWYCSMRSLVSTFLKSLQWPWRALRRMEGGRGISCQCSLAMRGRR